MTTVSDALRESVYATVGLIPVVGGYIGGLVNILWPHENNNVWLDIKKMVQLTVEGQMDEHVKYELESDLTGYKDSLKAYRDLPYGGIPNDKLKMLDFILNSLVKDEHKYMDQARPGISAAFFASMVTIRLELKRDRYMQYKQIYATQDEPPAQYLDDLKADIVKYSSFRDLLELLCIVHRTNKVTWSQNGDEFTVSDTATTLDAEGTWTYTIRGQDAQRQAQYAFDSRRAFLHNDVRSKLLDVLSVGQLWGACVPNPPKVSVVVPKDPCTSGPFPNKFEVLSSQIPIFPDASRGLFNSLPEYEHARKKDGRGGIRMIKFWIVNESQVNGNIPFSHIVTGLFIHHGDRELDVMVGRSPSNAKYYEINLEPERQSVIVGVRGAADTAAIQQLVFTVQRRYDNPPRYEYEEIGNKDFDNFPRPRKSRRFQCGPPVDAFKPKEHVGQNDEFDHDCGRLIGISGDYTSRKLRSIQFWWSWNIFEVAKA